MSETIDDIERMVIAVLPDARLKYPNLKNGNGAELNSLIVCSESFGEILVFESENGFDVMRPNGPGERSGFIARDEDSNYNLWHEIPYAYRHKNVEDVAAIVGGLEAKAKYTAAKAEMSSGPKM